MVGWMIIHYIPFNSFPYLSFPCLLTASIYICRRLLTENLFYGPTPSAVQYCRWFVPSDSVKMLVEELTISVIDNYQLPTPSFHVQQYICTCGGSSSGGSEYQYIYQYKYICLLNSTTTELCLLSTIICTSLMVLVEISTSLTEGNYINLAHFLHYGQLQFIWYFLLNHCQTISVSMSNF